MTGTITKRPTSKKGHFRWGYIHDGEPDETGKRRQVAKSGFKTKNDADVALRAALANFEAKVREERELSAEELREAISAFKEKRDTPPPPPEPEPILAPTFQEFFSRWMREHAARRCSLKTLEAYGQHGAYAVREFGSVRINELTTELLETALNRLQDSGGRKGRALAPKTIRHIFFVVSGALKKARKWKLIERNPMEDVDRPKKEAAGKKKPLVLDNGKMKRFLDGAETRAFYPLLVLAAATGCRRGELLALEWCDLNFSTGALLVTKSLEETQAGLRIKSTKSGEPREFSVPASALSVLERHREQQESERALYGQDYQEHNLIFARPDGAYYSPDQMSVRITKFARKAGFPGIGLHSLRHSHASQLLSSGTPIAAVADRLGHKNSGVTLSIYDHALPADVSAAAETWNIAMANVIQTERKARPTRMLVNVSGHHFEKTQVAEKKTG